MIFSSLREYVTGRFGQDATRRVFDGEPTYLLSEAYPDERLTELVRDACELTGVFAAETTFARLYPAYFSIAGAARPFLLTVEDRIHELVRSTIPNASPPQLHVEPLGEDGVRIVYTSPRRLCVLLKGLVEGTARHYGERVEIVETACMSRGDPACVFEVRLSRLASS